MRDENTVNDRLAALEALLAQQAERMVRQEAEIAQLRASLAGAQPEAAFEAPAEAPGGLASRRTLLKLGGAAAVASVAAGAAVIANHAYAAPATLTAWQTTTVSVDAETVVKPSSSGYSPSDILQVQLGTGSVYEPLGTPSNAIKAAIAAYDTTTNSIGVYGTSSTGFGLFGITNTGTAAAGAGLNGTAITTGTGVSGNSGSGVGVQGNSVTGLGGSFTGGSAPLYLGPGATVGAPTGGTHAKGEIYVDNAGAVWVCIAGGPPGTWMRLSGPQSGVPGGALNFLPHPIRIFDSRSGQPAPLPAVKAPVPANTVLSMQVTDPTVVGGLKVPVGATAVLANATAVSPSGPGFLSFWPNGQPFPGVSNLNYVGGQIVPNFCIVGLDASGKMAYEAGGGSSTDLIFDVAGYVL